MPLPSTTNESPGLPTFQLLPLDTVSEMTELPILYLLSCHHGLVPKGSVVKVSVSQLVMHGNILDAFWSLIATPPWAHYEGMPQEIVVVVAIRI